MRLLQRLYCICKEAAVRYQPYVGLEVHAQIMTRTKLFSSAEFDDSAHVNSCIALFDMGLPGTLPVLNKSAVMKGIAAGLALNCKIPKRCKFERKHYFYADLPIGYQITQRDQPIAHSGFFEFYVYSDDNSFVPYKKRINIMRIQLENDSGRIVHDLSNNRSLIDLNRAGVGLLEIVTSPDITSALEAYCFTQQLRLTLMANNLCGGEMQKGQFRVDVNISLGEASSGNFGVRTEIKNLNSLRMVRRAIDNEIARQRQILLSGSSVINETLTVDCSGHAVTMREKEVETDYRFLPETNLPPVHIKEEWIKTCKSMIVKPSYLKCIEEYGIEPRTALKIASEKSVTKFFEKILAICKTVKVIPVLVEWVYSLQTICHNCNKPFPPSGQLPKETFIGHFVEAIELFHAKKLTKLTTFDLLRRYVRNELNNSPTETANVETLWRIADKDDIIRIFEKVMLDNSELVAKVRKNGAKKHFTKLRTAVLNECNRQIEADEISELIMQRICEKKKV
ncbi:unnamed protein product [Thelazia callipaeda]|uniref:Glutamyl-tRNA(Gln) amidotransferase subunit B, mitochondrial n=1 Tax=Thelazia callipaeda TaxID=103827 RepID=A0A0N5D7H9_THECL|nr:unnamed protein product [Thelazia callipaeda]